MADGWHTIESDAGVFTALIEDLGVQGVQFEELVTLDLEELARLGHIHGVIFLFKYPVGEKRTATPLDGHYDHAAAERLFFANQVIQNACGTQALLSVLLNRDKASNASDEAGSLDHGIQNVGIDIGPQLRDFKDFTRAFPPDLRGEALSNSELIRTVHNSFARSSPFVDETNQPSAGPDDDVYHFIAYVPHDGVLYELDGLHPAPISHGPTSLTDTTSNAKTSSTSTDSNTAFCQALIPVLQRRIARYPAAEIRFNLLALIDDPRPALRAVGDQDGLARADRQRRQWAWENALRRYNLVGFVGEVLGAVVRQRLAAGGNAAYQHWFQQGVDRTTERQRKTRERRHNADVDAHVGDI